MEDIKSRNIYTQFFINGEYVDSFSDQTYIARNPADNLPLDGIRPIPIANAMDTERAIKAAREAFDNGPWPRMSAKERADILRRIADLIRESAGFFGFLEAWSIGKLLKASVNHEIPRSADNLSEFADAVEDLKDRTFSKCGVSYLGKKVNIRSIARRHPLGVGAVIIPWNSPVMHSTWKVAPCIAIGNTCVLKPPMWGALGVLQLGQIAREAGLPPGVLNIIAGEKEAGETLVKSPLVNKISFTGGDATGRMINKMNAEVRLVEPFLELGGKAPQIVFADIDIDYAVQGVAQSIFRSAGQSCVAGSRALIQEKIYPVFISTLVEYVRKMKIGNQFHIDTEIGPIVSVKHLKKIEKDIQMAFIENAYVKLLRGGKRPQGDSFSRGNYLEPTIFEHVTTRMSIWQEEVFGPVLVVMPFKDEEEAIRLANSTRYGLSSNVWTLDPEKGERVADRIDAGMTWIYSHFLRDLHAPFGGRKASGNCAESLTDSIYKWTQHKMICTTI